MTDGVTVYFATTWKDAGRRDHYRLYGVADSDQNENLATRVFDGMDGVVVDATPSTQGKGCWLDIEQNPRTIEQLIGPRGLAFLKILNRRMSEGGVSLLELRVVSAWQFSVLTPNNDSTVDLVFPALQEHLSRVPVRFEWVL